MSLDEVLTKYIELFEGIPLEEMQGWNDEQLLAAMLSAIETGKKIELKHRDDVTY